MSDTGVISGGFLNDVNAADYVVATLPEKIDTDVIFGDSFRIPPVGKYASPLPIAETVLLGEFYAKSVYFVNQFCLYWTLLFTPACSSLFPRFLPFFPLYGDPIHRSSGP